jgi:predicted 3-demethylubiquinone-9 3-methyltransferase (glyoxalase superfamily)
MSVEMEKKHGDIRTDKFVNQKDQNVVILDADIYRQLKHDASKWIMMEWATDNKIEFIWNEVDRKVRFSEDDLFRLETLYLAWLEEQRGVK